MKKDRRGGVDRSWKRAERRVGGMMGLPKGHQREGPTGLFDCVSSEGLTVDGKFLGVEVKYRKDIPDWLSGAISQADKHAEEVESRYDEVRRQHIKIDPVVVIVPHLAEEAEFLCALRFTDYIALRAAADRAQREAKTTNWSAIAREELKKPKYTEVPCEANASERHKRGGF